MTDDTLLSIPQVAKELNVTTTVVYRLIKGKALMPVRTEQRGGQKRRYFLPSDVVDLKRQREGHVEEQ